VSRTVNSYFIHRRFSARSSTAPAQINFTLGGLMVIPRSRPKGLANTEAVVAWPPKLGRSTAHG